MKKYKIPITWQSIEIFHVEAESLEDAIKEALENFFKIPDGKYLEDSFDIDHEGLEEEYKEEYNYDKIIKKINTI